jgi:hypothetical protein
MIGLWATVLSAQHTDPAFDNVPFDQWLKNPGDAHIKWSLRVSPAHLTAHQRLSTLFSAGVDGAEFVKRNVPGELVVFLEIRDSRQHAFRTHNVVASDALKNPSELLTVNVEQFAFIVPGDYQVTAAIYDMQTKEYGVKKAPLHVAELPHDALSGSTHDVPAVEFLKLDDPPDSWFLPEVTSRLSLPVKSERPVQVELVVNESPTEAAVRRSRTSRRNMGNLIPALKALSQMDIQNGSLNVSLLDLERRKVSFKQEDVKTLDWPRLRTALLDNDPNKIDVHELESHEQNAQFFVSEIRKRLESTESNGDVPLGLTSEPVRVLIVLTGPMAFSKGQDLRPIEAGKGARVYYIRYYPVNLGAPWGSASPGRRGRGPVPPPARTSPVLEDSLLRTLKPLGPKLFNVTTPLEFRSALVTIMAEISQIK